MASLDVNDTDDNIFSQLLEIHNNSSIKSDGMWGKVGSEKRKSNNGIN